jgi:hypothetical protein
LWIWTPMALNLPVGIVQLPYVILNPAKQEWFPARMDFRVWRAISWPIFGLLFWWVAGRSTDALANLNKGGGFPLLGLNSRLVVCRSVVGG